MGMHDRAKHPLPRKRWSYLKNLDVGPGRYIHISAEARMVVDQMAALFLHERYKPWVQKPGVTYNAGRNKAKRARRLMEVGRGN